MRRNIVKNSLIKYKWEQGVYSIEDMVALVQMDIISPEDFKEITRKDYQAMKEIIKRGDTN